MMMDIRHIRRSQRRDWLILYRFLVNGVKKHPTGRFHQMNLRWDVLYYISRSLVLMAPEAPVDLRCDLLRPAIRGTPAAPGSVVVGSLDDLHSFRAG